MTSTRLRSRRSSSNSDSSVDDGPPRSRRRRSSRGNSSLTELAKEICLYQKRVVFITGAGISVASGVRPFRGSSGVWTQHIWTTATREAFRKNPLEWYNEFWLPCLSLPENAKPNQGHGALSELLARYPKTVRMITQNVDGLHPPSQQSMIEAHGRLGLFKCMPSDDSDTDSDSDDDDDRLVHLGHRRKQRLAMKKKACPYQQKESLTVDQVEPSKVRKSLQRGDGRLTEAPKCPSCRNCIAPQALLFDEGYHSHDFYQFQRMEQWMAEAEVIVFVGTSFAVRLPEIALEHARAEAIPVYNFNTQDMLDSTVRLNATNVTGPSEETLPLLYQACQELQARLDVDATPGGTEAAASRSPGTMPGREFTVQT
jgi:NAD-dependent deacetylase